MDTTERSSAPARWRGSLAVRLVVFAVSLASLAAGGVAALSYRRAHAALEHEAALRLGILARDAAAELHREITGRLTEVESWTRLGVMRAVRIRDVDRELADLLSQLRSGDPSWRTIACIDGRGTVVASAGAPDAIHWTALAQTRARVAVGTAPGEPTLQFDVGILDPDRAGVPIGHLVAVTDLRSLLPAATAHRGASAAGVTVRADDVVVGRFAAAPSDGADALSGRATVPALADADAPTLAVTVTEPIAVALAPVDGLARVLRRATAIAILLASLLGAAVALWIGRPIRHLTQAVRAVANGGTLDLPADIATDGEVGLLAASFARTLATVREQQAELLAQSRLATLGEIAASVAHEVRTPLSVLKSSAQLLGRPELPAAEQRQLSGLIASEADRLNRVVTDLVDLARPRPVHYTHEPLRPVLERAVGLFAAAAARRRITLHADLGDDPLPVRACRDHLHQVFVNLLQNALQATPDGGQIAIAARSADGGVAITITDSGAGFPDALLPQLFTRFRTTKPDGSGLGLAISKRLVEEHGGRISAANHPGGGARLTVHLPRSTEAP